MARSVLLACAGIGLLASATHAADVTLNTTLTERGEASDNAFLKLGPLGPTYTSSSTMKGELIAATPTVRYRLNSDFTYRKYLGPGAADTFLTEVMEEGVGFDVEKKAKRTTYNVGASWQRRDVSTALLLDLGVLTPIRGTVDTSVVRGSVKQRLNETDTLTWTWSGTSTEFSSPTSTPFIDLKTGAVWHRQVNRSTDVTLLVDYDRQMFDNPAKSQTEIWRTMAGVQKHLTPRLSFTGNIGAGVVDISQNGTGPATGGPSVFSTSASGASVGLLWDTQLIYRLTNTTKITATASETIAPTILGDLTRRTSYGASVVHTINHRSDFVVSGDFSKVMSAGLLSELVTATAIYNYRFDRHWNSQLGYTFRQRQDTLGTAQSNTVFVAVTRDATLRP